MKKKYIIILVTLPFICLKCKKDSEIDPKLPPATQEGKNTFGCKVNGVIWVAYDKRWMGRELQANYRLNFDSSIYIQASRHIKNNNNNGVMILILDPFSGEVMYYLSGYPYDNNVSGSVYTSSNYSYITNDSIGGEVKITKFDTLKNILSGTFFFKALNDTSGNIVDITEGRFDIIYEKQ